MGSNLINLNLSQPQSVASSSCPCWLLTLGNQRILLDCSLSEGGSQPPRLLIPNVDSELIRTIDIILLSNYETLLSLPYVTEFGGFKGQIFATDPTVMFGKLRLEEFIRSKPLIYEANGTTRPCYSINEARSSISKIKSTVGPFMLTASSSGFCLGSANWMIEYHFQKILYLSTTSVSLNKHSSPLEYRSVEISGLSTASSTNDSQILQKSAKTIYSHLLRAIETGGTVVFLCKPFGTLFDLLELVETMMASMGMTVVVHVVSNVASESLTVCNILGEWPLEGMITSKRLITHNSVHTVFGEKPQVLFLDYGELSNEVLSAVLKWRGDRCVYILPESELPDRLNAIFSTSRTSFLHCPFNLGASEQEYITILESINPGLGIVIPQGTVAFNALAPGSCSFEIPIDSRRRYVRIEKSVAENSEFLNQTCARHYVSTLRGGASSLGKVEFVNTGFVERLVDAALLERNGVVVEKSEDGVVIELDLGRLVFSSTGNLSVESGDSALLEQMCEWIQSFKK
ncbi:beta-lactamase-like protein [Obelidium mucronatum]|nr:beta-lactamase-like protein [Obelidium mucronatum]